MATRHVRHVKTPPEKAAAKLMHEVEAMGHKLEVRGRALIETATRTIEEATRKVRTGAEEGLDAAAHGLAVAEKRVRRLAGKKPARRAPAARP